jgi:tRNA pseudouridine55 synthase
MKATRVPAAIPDRDPRIAEGEMLLVDKPKGWTSFDVVNKIRHLLHVRRVGHAGTLDPMATGLLIVCTGKKTGEIEQFVGLDKEYEAELFLGGRTASFDAEMPVQDQRSIEGITENRVREVFRQFVGPQQQLPPMWSAVKVKGKPLYAYARKGIEVERKARNVNIASIVLTGIDLPRVSFTVTCSKGTYVRTLVNDIGDVLGCGAYLTMLRRTRIGTFALRDAYTIDQLTAVYRDPGGRQ